MSSLYTIDQMKWFSDRLEEDGYTAEQFNLLGQSGRLREMLCVLRGTHEIRPIDHMINLSIPCKLPFTDAEHVSSAKSGIVRLERHGDDLCLDGKKINLFLSDGQKGGFIVGHELRKELEAKDGNVSAKVLDHTVEHPELWPESWKKDDQGRTIYIFFWDDIFRLPVRDRLYVRYGCWGGGRVVSHYRWLGYGWNVRSPAASLAS